MERGEAHDGALRWVRADDPGPFTLDGTRTHIVGRRHVAVIDPGPDMVDHVRAVVSLVGAADEVTLLLSHGHGDHAGAADALIQALPDAARVGHGHPAFRSPGEGARIATDRGEIVVVPTPGHTQDHLAFHWPERGVLFAADMVLGRGDTTWVAEYPGCVADWLDSLARLEAMEEIGEVRSAHGPAVTEVADLWRRYRAHREARIEAVRATLTELGVSAAEARRGTTADRVFRRVYGDTVPQGLEEAARRSLDAVLEYVDSGPGHL